MSSRQNGRVEAEEDQSNDAHGRGPAAPGYTWQPPVRGGWTPDWVRDAVFYQIFPDRFARSGRVPAPGPFEPWDAPPTANGIKGGDLHGVTERLTALADLGVTALYLNPVFTSASNHRYHTDDYLAVDPLLGGDEALRDLLKAAHDRGLRVILDGVFNHTGRGHQPFVHVLENGAASPYRSWYHFDEARLAGGRPLTPYAPVDGPHDDVFRRAGYQAWWGLAALPTLAHAQPEVRDFLYRVAEHWIRFGADGWRLDVPGEITQPGFWEGFRERVKAVRQDAYIVGEVWSVSPEWLAGDRFDALMDYPFTEAILGFAGGPRLDPAIVGSQHEYAAHVRASDGPAFAHALTDVLAAYAPEVTAVQLRLLGSHDTPRFRTVCGGDPVAYRLATLLQMTRPGAPCIDYGDELGLEGGADPGCRGAMPTDPGAGDTSLRAFVAGAIALRRAHPCLRDAGRWRVAGANGGAYAHLRWDDREAFVVAVDAADDSSRLTLQLPELAGRRLQAVRWRGWPQGQVRFAAASADGSTDEAEWSESSATLGPDGRLVIELAGRQGLVLQAA